VIYWSLVFILKYFIAEANMLSYAYVSHTENYLKLATLVVRGEINMN